MFNKTLLKIAHQLLDDIGDLMKKQVPAEMNSFELVEQFGMQWYHGYDMETFHRFLIYQNSRALITYWVSGLLVEVWFENESFIKISKNEFLKDLYLHLNKILIILHIPLEPNILCTDSYSNCGLKIFCVCVWD